ncbi:hypothetical protein QYF36_005288 [Acer negundo]|nr:hypothetical protein QYF36_005288 [Acer negundo]
MRHHESTHQHEESPSFAIPLAAMCYKSQTLALNRSYFLYSKYFLELKKQSLLLNLQIKKHGTQKPWSLPVVFAAQSNFIKGLWLMMSSLFLFELGSQHPSFYELAFPVKPNGLDDEFKDETLEPADVERQQPYMIGFDNDVYMGPDMHLGGGLLDESQNKMT